MSQNNTINNKLKENIRTNHRIKDSQIKILSIENKRI